MNKKGFICSLVLSVLVTLSLGIYTLVSLFYVPTQKTPEKPYEPKNTTTQFAFRSGEEVSFLDGYSEEDGSLTFVVEEGQTNPISLNEETGKYVAGSEKGEVKAVVKTNDKGDTNTYEISVYPHSDAGLTEDAPFVIANKTHLKEFADILNDTSAERRTLANDTAIRFVELVSDIDLGGENWKPMGSYTLMVEGLTFNGNGHTIKNMTINVDINNFEDFIVADNSDEKSYMNIGFFGAVSQSTILDLNFTGAVINITSDVYNAISATDYQYNSFPFGSLNVGIIVARASNNTTIVGSDNNSSIEAKINAFSFAKLSTPYAEITNNTIMNAGVGGVIGYAINTSVSKYDVELNVVNNVSTVYNSTIGGVVGRMRSVLNDSAKLKNTIEQCNVSMDVTSIYSNHARIAGIVSAAENVDIINCDVKKFKVYDSTYFGSVQSIPNNGLLTSVAGVVQAIYSNGENEDYYSLVSNVNVENIDVNMRFGLAAGVAHFTDDQTGKVTFTNVSAKGNIYAHEAYGFAVAVKNETTISYNQEFEGKAIDVKLTGDYAAAFAGDVYGQITGFEDDNDNKTEVIADIRGLSSHLPNNDDETRIKANNLCLIAGFVAELKQNAEISMFKLNVNIYNGFNMAGVVGKLQGGSVSDMDVDARITSNNFTDNGNDYSTTNMVGGVACFAEESSKIENVNVNLNVNQDVDKNHKYGATFFGGLVARLENGAVTLNNNTVSGKALFNYTYYTAYFNVDAENQTGYDVFIAGGLIGSVTAYGTENPQDEFLPVDAADLVVTNNIVKDFEMVADFDYEVMSIMEGVRVRALGILLGNYYSNNALDLSSNSFDNVQIASDSDTFTAMHNEEGSTEATTVNAMGYNKTENKFVHSYGVAIMSGSTGIIVPAEHIADVAGENVFENAAFTELNADEE